MGSDPVEVQEIRAAIARLLLQHLTRQGVNEENDSPSLKRIEALTLLYLLHEREKEIAAGGSPSPERPTRESLLADLADIDPQGGSSASNHLDQLIADGLVAVSGDLGFTLTPRAVEKVASYDAAFPGMPGLSFVAYLIQTMQEVSSGRKPLTVALQQVDQTLMQQGRHQSHTPVPPVFAQDASGHSEKNPARVPPREPSSAPRASLQQWYRLREAEGRQKPQPRVVTRSGYTPQFEVKSLFPRKNAGQAVEKSAAAEPGIQWPAAPKCDDGLQEAHLRSGGADPPSRSVEAGGLPTGGEGEDRSPRQAKSCNERAAGVAFDTQPASEIDFSEAKTQEPQKKQEKGGGTPASPQASIGGEGDINAGAEAFGARQARQPRAAEPERGPGEQTGAAHFHGSLLPPSDTAEDVHSGCQKIAAFENDLAIHCPICRTGSVQPAVTPKGKTYYACSQSGCNFISWGKPHHFMCPVCGNPFLVEASIRSQGVGLKCPRATCTYRQAHVNAPAPQTPSFQLPPNRTSTAGNGLRKVVRKVVRRTNPG